MKYTMPMTIKEDFIQEILTSNLKVRSNTDFHYGERDIVFEYDGLKYDISGDLNKNGWEYTVYTTINGVYHLLTEDNILHLFAKMRVDKQLKEINTNCDDIR
jgi:hypothetical protein